MRETDEMDQIAPARLRMKLPHENHGGPAFPMETGIGGGKVTQFGMSMRDYFAAQVMSHMISLSRDVDGGWDADNVARGCYNLADAMLRARIQTES